MINGFGDACPGMDRSGGCDDMVTPHFDALMKDSLTLTNSHVQVAVCSPSRTSLLFGRRPDTTHVYDLYNNAREVGCKDCTTLPGLFKEAGYTTVGMGKIFHDGHASGGGKGRGDQDHQSWDASAYPWFKGSDHGAGECQSGRRTASWSSVDESKVGLCQDSQVREHAIQWMRKLVNGSAGGSKPWFLAVGFRKPHLPFVAPQEFFAYYPLAKTKLAPNPYAPAEMPAIAYASYELQSYADVKALGFRGKINETLSDTKARDLVRAYKAAVSYTDYNMGMVAKELKALGQWDKTVLVFWGDHGWKLGHHGAWAKHTNWREDTNSPVMLRVPGKTDGGLRSDALVDHVDIMATLVEATGIEPIETCPASKPWTVKRCTEGQSFMPLVEKPHRQWKNASYSQYQRRANIMGYSMTLANARFTAWVTFDQATNTTNFDLDGCNACGLELYDHVADPLENYNLAYLPENKELVAKHLGQLKAGWRGTMAGLERGQASLLV
eukprot:TRINITY_DN58105_c0_g1_i1.p1 TRINITY_DN58105_c0_g1~~TRINITY_DN58105_c0_g1_i1.p1  ORF type:complete len:552 (-),score=101.94 TRINITY_DN58105_c0_g1_i1:61-1548(-)